MLDKFKRLAVVVIMAACLGVFFESSHSVNAESTYESKTKHWVWPVLGDITDTYGTRNGKHKGLDIAAPYGEPTYSVDEGKVTKSYYSSTYGNVVFVLHPNGFETVYAHLSKRAVEEGASVKKGQKIGEVGSTGISSGAHLHFEVHIGEWTYAKNNAINPLQVLDKAEMVALINEKSVNKKAQLHMLEQAKGYNSTNSVEVSKGHKVGGAKEETIIVEKGQTLWDLSIKHKVSIETLMKWNNLKEPTIYHGQKLVVFSTAESIYVVKTGDSLSSIAASVGLTVQELKSLNQLTNDIIHPDQKLIIEKS